MKIKGCPNCGITNRIHKVHICSKRLPFWWYVECDNCHYCGKTKLFLRRAIKSWNKREGLYEKEKNLLSL